MAKKTHKTVGSLLTAQRIRYEKFQGTIRQAHHALVADSAQDHVELTSGTISKGRLKALGHPFGRGDSAEESTSFGLARGTGRGQQKVPLLPINRQSGRLQRSLKWFGPRGRDLEYRVWFDAPHARYITHPSGTKKMIGRGLRGPKGQLRRLHKARLRGVLIALKNRHRNL